MKSFTPYLTKLPKRSVLTITTIGDPNNMTDVFPALYGTAYTTKFKVFKPKNKEMKIGACSAFWPDAHLKPKSKWTGIWTLEIPSFVKQRDLIQKNPKLPTKIKTLPAGTYAQILHIGPYNAEKPTILKLHAFIKQQKLKIAGPHEEVYMTRPGPKAKTIIQYLAQKKK
jgi:hypothetical protein